VHVETILDTMSAQKANEKWQITWVKLVFEKTKATQVPQQIL
jgi:hypothetical protein